MRELAVAVRNGNENTNPIETIHSIKNAGFKNVFIEWYDKNWQVSQQTQVDLCRELGLNIVFAHLGYQKVNSLWLEGEEGDLEVGRYKKDIEDCSKNNINMVIMHLTSKTNPAKYNELGLNRLKEIAKFAKEKNVKIAFENTKIKGYLEYVLGNIKDENVGLCYDAGHCHLHFDDDFDIGFCKNRVFAVHMHDNDKTDDLHLLPFDATIDWNEVVEKLKNANYNGPVTLEVTYRYDYLKKSLDEFYKEAYKRADKIRKMFSEI